MNDSDYTTEISKIHKKYYPYRLNSPECRDEIQTLCGVDVDFDAAHEKADADCCESEEFIELIMESSPITY